MMTMRADGYLSTISNPPNKDSMASNEYVQAYADGTSQTVKRFEKQGRKKSPDPLLPITVRLPKSWLDEMDDPRHIIRVALYEYRTRKLVKS